MAAEAGADALGFVFYPSSPRCVSVEKARDIIKRLPPYVTTVGVFADQDEKTIQDAVSACGLDIIQLQGKESPEFCERLGLRVIKAIRVKDRASLQGMERYHVRAYLLDTYRKGIPGGTGESFDWAIAGEAKKHGRIILAGGLTPENVAEAIDKVQPYAIDVSSGVETSPGKKDAHKTRRFIAAARERCQ